MNDDRDLQSVVGEQVSTVSFVMDYVEFGFNGPILRALTNPTVEAGRDRYAFPEPGSRDALCEYLIGREIASVAVFADDRIEVETDDGARLIVPLDEGSRRGPEAAHFVPADPTGAPLTAKMLIW